MTKRVLLTGGGRGLGRVTAEKLATLGRHVLLVARTLTAAHSTVDEIRRRHRNLAQRLTAASQV